MAAATAVFGTAELSEMILLHLPMRDLLLVQRVNKDIRTVIGSSKILQRKLFFEAAPGGPLTFFKNSKMESPYSGLYAAGIYKKETYKLPATAEEASGWPWMWHNSETAPGVPVAVEKNPVVTWVMSRILRAMGTGEFRPSSLPSELSDPRASWRRMRITQPFAACPLLIGFRSRRTREEFRSLPISAEGTLGDVVDRLSSEPYTSTLRKRIKPFIDRGTFERLYYRHWDGQGTSGAVLWDRATWVEGRDRLWILELQNI